MTTGINLFSQLQTEISKIATMSPQVYHSIDTLMLHTKWYAKEAANFVKGSIKQWKVRKQ